MVLLPESPPVCSRRHSPWSSPPSWADSGGRRQGVIGLGRGGAPDESPGNNRSRESYPWDVTVVTGTTRPEQSELTSQYPKG